MYFFTKKQQKINKNSSLDLHVFFFVLPDVPRSPQGTGVDAAGFVDHDTAVRGAEDRLPIRAEAPAGNRIERHDARAHPYGRR